MQIKISLPEKLLAYVDEARGDVTRSVWIRRRLEEPERWVAHAQITPTQKEPKERS